MEAKAAKTAFDDRCYHWILDAGCCAAHEPILLTFLLVALLFAALLSLPLAVGVWLPDVFSAPRHTLAEQHLASGHSFRVIQYWNRLDFYNTELLHTSPNGVVKTHVLDGDDSKTWHIALAVNEPQKTATVTLRGGRVKTVDWK